VDPLVTERRIGRGATERALVHLRTIIAEGRLDPGNRVPSERELAATIGVARPTVRSALRILTRAGIVRPVRGVGHFVVQPAGERPAEPAAAQPQPPQPARFEGAAAPALAEMRCLIEGGSAALAAERATPEQCAAIADEVSNLYAAVSDPQLFLVHDLRFHRAIGEASGNPLLATMVAQLTEASFERARQRPPLASVDGLRDAAARHRRIYRAIRDHDPERARLEMQAHLAPSHPPVHPQVALVR
jgi:GntR family transcriptional repressor for pyruvate dehydrogenase complex